MKIDVIEVYKDEYDSAYVTVNSDNRKRVSLIGKNGKNKWISYARYLWESINGKVPEGYEVDHINNDKTDDRIENLQLLSKHDNIIKYKILNPAKTIKRICPVCGKEFDFPLRNLSTHPNPCCSRDCGYKKGVLKKNNKFLKSFISFKVSPI